MGLIVALYCYWFIAISSEALDEDPQDQIRNHHHRRYQVGGVKLGTAVVQASVQLPRRGQTAVC